jgi:hypothetical protein
MRLPRFSVATGMLAVVLVSLDLGTARYLFFASHLDIIITIMPIVIALQVASLACLNRRAEVRTFCAGFLAGGSAAAMLFFCAMFFRESRLNSLLGRYWVVSSESLRYYLPFTKRLFHDRVQFVIQGFPIRLGALTEMAMLFFIPQLLSALIVGWLALVFIQRPHREGPSGQS